MSSRKRRVLLYRLPGDRPGTVRRVPLVIRKGYSGRAYLDRAYGPGHYILVPP